MIIFRSRWKNPTDFNNTLISPFPDLTENNKRYFYDLATLGPLPHMTVWYDTQVYNSGFIIFDQSFIAQNVYD